ncbi:actinorhodin polyketide putative beta-ketoacyl synthase 2 [Pilimelia anulata]|uniref:Actinorhodin polyketide putative beta-ketoacyl synthase 2 n=1 Tax=Pilimelia anulata TaxID=53371 RepID=A0A8J3B634_9ACTN|nr:beta-ketoacyl synthase N-terminal-like domain-containing protein [Pilimelia anulata]GGJ96531.1 actinorhodin polyketide putative beta-ketoacyl synthase 2 [Pilimelia anulata]
MNQDTVVTGIGVAAPTGVGAQEYWAATLKGVGAIRPLDRFAADRYPVRLAAAVPDTGVGVPGRLVPQTDRLTRLALVAAAEALADARLDAARLPEYGVGVAVSSSTGGLEFGQRQLQLLWGTGWEAVSPYMSFAWYYAVNTGQISIGNGLRGPGGVVVAEQAGGLDSLAFARRRVRRGASAMAAGGFDSLLCPYGMAAMAVAAGASRATDPATAYLPFCAGSTGFVPGEGGAVLILESRAGAAERGAPTVYGVLRGHAAAFDPPGGTGDALARAARAALADAGLDPSDVDVVFADSAGSPAADGSEAGLLADLFGPRGVPVSAPKALVGRLGSGGSALDVVCALLAIRDGLIPAVPGVDPAAVDPRVDLVVGEPRAGGVGAALVLSRGHGGFASAAVVTAP